MEFNYIYLQEIQGSEKISLIRSLKESNDLKLFQKEAIQRIIDYKWNTYADRFFKVKFFIYLIFTMFFYWDMMKIPSKRVPSTDEDINTIVEYHGVEIRVKDYQFYIRKIAI